MPMVDIFTNGLTEGKLTALYSISRLDKYSASLVRVSRLSLYNPINVSSLALEVVFVVKIFNPIQEAL